MQTRYAPPPVDQPWLLAKLMDTFETHKQDNRRPDALLQELVHGYLMWWVLMVTFPKRRIVGTGPHWIVRRIHASDLQRFISDCAQYLGRIPQKEDLWGGALDFRGTHDTARSIHELFDFPDIIWEPILRTAKQQKDEAIIRLN